MPCLFGSVGGSALAAPYRRLAAHFAGVFGTVEEQCVPGAWLGAHAHAPSSALRIDAHERPFGVYGERDLYRAANRPHPGAEIYAFDGPDDMLRLTGGARGNVAVYDPRTRELSLGVDWTSFFPLYYARTPDGVVFSTHLKPLADALGATLDPVGVAQALTQNWCLNGRTVFAGIRRVLPGQSLRYRVASDTLADADTSRLWTADAWPGSPATLDTIWELLCASAATAWSGSEPIGLMMSGGWDSRLLLAATLARRTADLVTTLTHGDPANREPRIAARLARDAAVRHLEIALRNDAFGDSIELDRLFDRSEALLFPYWRLAPAAAKQQGLPSIGCGLLGEVLGGHYTVRGGYAVRIRHYARQILFNAEDRDGQRTVDESFGAMFKAARNFRRQLWYLNPEFLHGHIDEIGEGLESDIDATLQRYRARGVTSSNALLQAYIVEHRALTMLGDLPRTALDSVDVQMPFASRELVAAVLSMSFDARFERNLCQQLLRRHRPDFLRLPLAATMGVPAAAPLVLQQCARLVRRGLDRSAERLTLRTQGRLGRTRRFGWMNFDETLRGGTELQEICRTLQPEVFNCPAIDQRIRDVREYRRHIKLGHVYLKMAWLSRLMRPARIPAGTFGTPRRCERIAT